MFFSRTRCQPESESEVSGEEDGEEAEDTGEVAADEPGEDVGEGAGGGDGRQPHDGLAKATTKLKPPRTCLELILKPTVNGSYLVCIFTSFCENDSCIQKHDWPTFSSPVLCQQNPCILDPM